MTTTVIEPTDPEQSAETRSGLPALLVVAVAVVALTAIPVVTDKLQLLDVVCLLVLPFIVGRVAGSRLVRLVCGALVLWAAGQVLSDVWNGLGPRISMPMIIAISILGVVPMLVFLGRADGRRIRMLVAAVAAGLILESIFVEHTSPISAANWKFGLNTPVTIVLLALTDLAWRRGRRAPSILALVAVAAIGVITDDRHLAGFAVLTIVVLMFRTGRRHPRTVSVFAGLFLLLTALSGVFIQAAESGALGTRSGGQVAQFGGTPQSILVNVRPEPFQEFYLFLLRPWLGWGSLPHLDSAAYLGSKEFLLHLGVVRTDLDSVWLPLEVPGVSAHSQMMDSLARAGVAAAPFWLVLLGIAIWAGSQAIRFRSSPLVVMWTILVVWDAFFSPLAGLGHVQLGAYLALVITSLRTDRPTEVPDL